MDVSRIYTDFSPEIRWIRDTVIKESRELPGPIREVAEFYLRRRLTIVFDKRYSVSSDPLFGAPDPYAVFWLADAFGLSDADTVRRVALGMVHATLSITLRDDMLDKARWTPDHYLWLSDFYFSKYHDGFKRIFRRRSDFWYYFSEATAETARYEAWRIGFQRPSRLDPLSPRFLGESSRYFVSVVAPSLVAIAIRSGRSRSIPRIMRFLRDFAMAWRIFDDLCDWDEDLKVPTLNRSSVLYHLRPSEPDRSTLGRQDVLRAFASRRFVDEVYGAMLRFLAAAGTDLLPLKSSYLDAFIHEQTTFHELRRDRLLGSVKSFESRLVELLSE